GEPAAPTAGRLRFTGEGLAWLAAALLLGGLGWVKSLNLLLVLAYLMLALLVLNGVLARAHARRVAADRLPVPPVYAGEEAWVRVVVRNLGRRPATVFVQDLGTTWYLANLPDAGEVECGGRRRFSRRGRQPASAPIVSSSFPFGLLRYDRRGVAAEG